MNPFMMFEHLGDITEFAYKAIYTGCGTEFGNCIIRIIHILEKLVDAGMLENVTKKKIEKFLAKDMSLSNMQVISRNTNDVVLVNTEIHELDSFDLRQFITWITEELCSDPIMKKMLCGRNNYEGVKKVLNSYADTECRLFEKENWIDYYVCKDKVFYTKRDVTGIHLYKKEKCDVSSAFSRERKKYKDIQLIKENLLDGRIYNFTDETVLVETGNDYIVRVCYVSSGRLCYSRRKGSIINQLEDGSLLFIENDKLMRLNPDGRKIMLMDNAVLGMVAIEGNQVFWRSRLRKKDMEIGNTGDSGNLTCEQITYCLKNNRVNKEMLWKGLLFTLYDFDRMNFDNKIGNRFRFAEFFDVLPAPFSLNEIVNRLSVIERYCYDGDVIKTDGYIEAMGYLISLEGESLDEKETVDALDYLLDNVTRNPYEWIVDSSGLRIIDSIDFFFGDTEEDDEIHFEGEDELKTIFEDADNMSAEQFDKNLDNIISEIERQIEKEKQREKEASLEEESNKQKNKKNSRGNKNGKRLPGGEDEKVGRSAGAIELPVGE